MTDSLFVRGIFGLPYPVTRSARVLLFGSVLVVTLCPPSSHAVQAAETSVSPATTAQANTTPNVDGDAKTMTDERKDFAVKTLAEHPDWVAAQYKDSVLAGRVELGMTPYEAKLAGGAFFFNVSADKEHWGRGADPYDVMWAQTFKPDNSQITMTFKTSTQFLPPEETIFRVFFDKGRAVKIEKVEGGPDVSQH
jgi:hypothetical protein